MIGKGHDRRRVVAFRGDVVVAGTVRMTGKASRKPAQSPQKENSPWPWLIGAAVLIFLVVAWFFLPLESWVETVADWIKDQGVWGVLLFIAAYVLGALMLVPGAAFSFMAGVVFGLGWGYPLALASATLAALAAFLVARYLVRGDVARMIETHPNFKAVDKAIGEEGWKVVVLFRLSPLVPFVLQNYFFGMTEVRLAHFLAGTMMGILPGTLWNVYLGALGKSALEGDATPLQWGLFAVGLIATIAVTIFIARAAQGKRGKRGKRERKI